MTALEKRAGISLAAIFALRMLGLFLILPVFVEHARHMPDGGNLKLVGLALGAFGLTQALFQIPFGIASDRYGRKPVIIAGLVLFAIGSFVAAGAHDIFTVLIGRSLQGAGAISAAVTALAADLTRDQHRTKVMAMIGSSIGLVFAASLVAAPLLYAAIGLSGIFTLTGVLAILAIGAVRWIVPEPPSETHGEAARVRFSEVLVNPQLLRLNFGIFSLHLIQMAMWVVVPAALIAHADIPLNQHWKVYLPVVIASFILMVPAIIVGEKKAKMKPVFLAAIVLLMLTELGFLFGDASFGGIVALLLSFFVAFNLLEATLPSLISRIAPPRAKGAALGVYNTAQSIGAALGAVLGGTLVQYWGAHAVFAAATLLSLLWLLAALSMRPPPVIASREYSIDPHVDLEVLTGKLSALPGVREAVIVPERRMAYLKVNLDGWDERLLRPLIHSEAQPARV